MPTALGPTTPATRDWLAPSTASILRPAPVNVAGLDFDLEQRYALAARLLDRLCTGLTGPVRVLEVGSNVVNLLPHYIDPGRVRVVRCDTLPSSPSDGDYVRLDPDAPLPFPDGSFDAVAALETLEHVPAERREAFLAECLRVARRGTVFTCPNGHPAVEAAERVGAAAYAERHGSPHPFLREHEEFGLPREEDVRAILRRLDVPHAVFDQAPLDVWQAALLLSETLNERTAGEDLREEVRRAFAARPPAGAVPYRKVYVCAKAFDATPALEPLHDVPTAGAEVPDVSRVLNRLATAATEALLAREKALNAEPTALRVKLQHREGELKDAELRFYIHRTYLQALERSAVWRLLAPLRVLRRLLRPRGFTQADLIPWQQLEPVRGEPPGTWESTGGDPQFVVPCVLPAGWVRLRLKMTSPWRGRLEVLVERGGYFAVESTVGQVLLAAGTTEGEYFIRLPWPTRAVRIDPLDCAGKFRLEWLDLTPRPAPAAAVDAVRRKLELLRAYRNTGPVLRRGLGMLLRGRFRDVVKRCQLGLNDPRCPQLTVYEPDAAYRRWIERRRLTEADRERQRAWAAGLAAPPLISVLMPTYNTPEAYLRKAIDSVRRQTYPHWQLCVADDGSTQPHVRAVLEEYADRDPRIQLAPPRGNAGISAATNAALGLADGDFVALLDHDDELAEHALFRMAEAVVADPTADMLYSDEDKLEGEEGRRVRPFFKPDWSPEFFLSCMYTCHLGVYRTALVRAVGGFRPEFDGAQDYDLVLRLTEQTDRIVHVPDVLYHWRMLATSTASGVAAKPHAVRAGFRALDDHLRRTGRAGSAGPGPSEGLNLVRFDVVGRPRVSIIIPSACRPAKLAGRKTSHLEHCVGSIVRGTRYPDYEILVLDRNDMPPEMQRRLEGWKVRRVTYDDDFNWSRVNNLGAETATGTHLLFLNDDVELISTDWLERMLEYSQQGPIGAVGAKLLFPDGGLQHASVTVVNGLPGHPFYGFPGHHPGYFSNNLLVRNCAAVTGACLMTRAEVFRELGGFDESFPLNYNDVDYCLRLRRHGYRVVYTPHAQLLHYESATKPGVFRQELDAFQARWGQDLRDPYYNPNLTAETHDYRVGE